MVQTFSARENVKKMYYQRKRAESVYSAINYSYPKLHTGKSWYVDFVCYDPAAQKMRRKKYSLDGIPSVRERRKRAAELISNLSTKLNSGWNVWAGSNETKQYTELPTIFSLYQRYLDRLCDIGTMKQKTYHGYSSYLGIFTDWINSRVITVKYVYQLSVELFSDFLDYVLIERESTARTRNNYRMWIGIFCTWLIEKGYLKENPIDKIKTIKEQPKLRNALSSSQLKTLYSHLEKTDKFFLLACQMEYYTFIRPKELACITIGDISIKNQQIFISSSISKNRRDGMVAINDTLIRLMIDLEIFNNPSDFFLFGRHLFPANNKTDERIFREKFSKVRQVLGFDSSCQFYSLKDSGIRDLANSEGIVVARDQARHGDVSTTNKYLKGDSLTVHDSVKHFRGEL